MSLDVKLVKVLVPVQKWQFLLKANRETHTACLRSSGFFFSAQVNNLCSQMRQTVLGLKEHSHEFLNDRERKKFIEFTHPKFRNTVNPICGVRWPIRWSKRNSFSYIFKWYIQIKNLKKTMRWRKNVQKYCILWLFVNTVLENSTWIKPNLCYPLESTFTIHIDFLCNFIPLSVLFIL
jgi:hypothetical protein